jgi:carboxyvinyl-carboxyphosphonate phosphorylmutase
VYETQKALREGTAPKALKGLPSADLTNRVMREADVKGRNADLLGLKK